MSSPSPTPSPNMRNLDGLMHVCVLVSLCACLCACVNDYAYVCMHACMHTHTHKHTHTHNPGTLATCEIPQCTHVPPHHQPDQEAHGRRPQQIPQKLRHTDPPTIPQHIQLPSAFFHSPSPPHPTTTSRRSVALSGGSVGVNPSGNDSSCR